MRRLRENAANPGGHLAGRVVGLAHLVLEIVVQPPGAAFANRLQKIVLAGEITVERLVRAPGLRDDVHDPRRGRGHPFGHAEGCVQDGFDLALGVGAVLGNASVDGTPQCASGTGRACCVGATHVVSLPCSVAFRQNKGLTSQKVVLRGAESYSASVAIGGGHELRG